MSLGVIVLCHAAENTIKHFKCAFFCLDATKFLALQNLSFELCTAYLLSFHNVFTVSRSVCGTTDFSFVLSENVTVPL